MTQDYEHTLKIASKKHDITGIRVYDIREEKMPDLGMVSMQDAETGEQTWIDTGNDLLQYNYAMRFMEAEDACRAAFRRAGADLLYIRTDEDHIRILQGFFLKRK